MGEEKNFSRFVKKLTAHMKNELYVFTSPGTASIIILHEKPQHSDFFLKIAIMMMFQCNLSHAE